MLKMCRGDQRSPEVQKALQGMRPSGFLGNPDDLSESGNAKPGEETT